MTDNDKSKSKPHEFRESFYTYDASGGEGSVPRRAWVPEAEAQEKITELESTVRLRGERLDAYVEEIERLREACAAARAEAAHLSTLLRGEREARARLQRERGREEDSAALAAQVQELRAEAARLREARDMNAAERDTARAERDTARIDRVRLLEHEIKRRDEFQAQAAEIERLSADLRRAQELEQIARLERDGARSRASNALRAALYVLEATRCAQDGAL